MSTATTFRSTVTTARSDPAPPRSVPAVDAPRSASPAPVPPPRPEAREEAAGSAPPDCAYREPVRFGYSMEEIDRIASNAAATALWRGGLDRPTRFETARSAIAELLCTAEADPGPRDLHVAGCTAIREQARTEARHHGTARAYEGASRVSFERYWAVAANPTPSAENRIVERAALAQIWPELKPRLRCVLLALAEHEDYKRAAASLGLSYPTFCSEVSRARRAFLALWHEGEAPSQPWGADVRTRSVNSRGHSIHEVLAKRRESRRRRNGQEVKPRRRDLDAELDDADMARRFKSGESLRSIAESLNIAVTTVHRRIAPYR